MTEPKKKTFCGQGGSLGAPLTPELAESPHLPASGARGKAEGVCPCLCLCVRCSVRGQGLGLVWFLDFPDSNDRLKPGNPGIRNLHSSDTGEYNW